MVRYSTALSHIILAGTGLYCLKALSGHNLNFARVSFGLIAINSLLGVWRYGNPSYGYKIDKLHRLTSILQDLLVLPCIVTTIWLNCNYTFELACAHSAASLLPLVVFLFDDKSKEVIDAFLGGNCFSLVMVSFFNENHFGTTAAMSFVLNYFCIKRDAISYLAGICLDVPTQDLFNYSMCFFAYFALKAVLYTPY